MLHVQLGTDLRCERPQANQLRSQGDRSNEHRRERASVAPAATGCGAAHAARAKATRPRDEVPE
jgi:hypothetical protein